MSADSVSSVSASACHIGGPNSVNPGPILLDYGTHRRYGTNDNYPILTSVPNLSIAYFYNQGGLMIFTIYETFAT